MTLQHASACVLGACAMTMAVLLALPVRPTNPPVRERAASGNGTVSASGFSHVALDRAGRTLRALHVSHHADPPHSIAVALCADCGASRALVRVVLRRGRHGFTPMAMRVYSDRSWPELDSLIARTAGSSLRVVPTLDRTLGLTPVALTSSAFVVGLRAVSDLLTPSYDRHEP